MRLRSLADAIAALVLLAASPAFADQAAEPKPESIVKLSPVALPVLAGGRVVNFVFIEAHILLTSRADPIALSDKEPYFRDALVRSAYRTPFSVAGDLNRIDEGKLRTALYRDAVAIVGPNLIKGVVIDSQEPQHRLAKPAPAAPPPPPSVIP